MLVLRTNLLSFIDFFCVSTIISIRSFFSIKLYSNAYIFLINFLFYKFTTIKINIKLITKIVQIKAKILNIFLTFSSFLKILYNIFIAKIPIIPPKVFIIICYVCCTNMKYKLCSFKNKSK